MDKRIVIYCRVSTDSEQQLNSLENQKTLFVEKIKNDNDTLQYVYFDEGLTGTKLNNRKGFNSMLTAAGIDVVETVNRKILANGNYDKRVKQKTTSYILSDRVSSFDCIYIKNTSRFARNTLSYDIIVKLRQKNVCIYFLEQNINTFDYSSDFLLQLFQVFDQNDSRDKSSKVSTGIAQSSKKGVIRTNNTIFGYNYDKPTNSLKIIDDEANIIRRIFELYTNGYGFHRIINILHSENLKTRSGNDFCKTTLSRILQNEKYYGGNPILKYSTGRVFEKNSYPLVNDSYDVPISEKIEPIISKDLFDKCQSIILSKNKTGIPRYVGLSKFSGHIFCSHCGSSYVSDKDKNKNSVREFFRCSGKRHNGLSYCNSKNILKSSLEFKLKSDMDNHILENLYLSCVKLIEQQLNHIDSIYSLSTESDISNLELLINNTQSEIINAFSEFSNNHLLESTYNLICSNSNAKLLLYQQKLDNLKNPLIIKKRKKDVLTIRLLQIQKKLLVGLTETDYLEYLDIKVYPSGNFLYSYNLPELKQEFGSTISLINEKHGI